MERDIRVAETKRPLKTEIQLDASEFEHWDIQEKESLTLSFREFKAVIGLAEILQVSIAGFFDSGGSPIVFCVKNEMISGDFIIATLRGERDGAVQSQRSLVASSSLGLTQQPIPLNRQYESILMEESTGTPLITPSFVLDEEEEEEEEDEECYGPTDDEQEHPHPTKKRILA